MANPTASSIIDLARNLLREDSGSDVPVIGDTFLLTAISDGNLKWARRFRSGGVAPIVFQRETGFDLVADTQLNEPGGITTSDNEIIVDNSDNFDTTNGAFVIWDDNLPDLISYTTNTVATETFTGVTNIGFAHEDNDVVQKLYKLPTNFGQFREAPGYGDGVRLNGSGLRFTGGPPDPGFFSMYDDGTNKFLWLPRGASNSASIWYDKNSTTIDSTDDTVDLPEEAQMFLVWHALSLCYVGREQDYGKMIAAKNEANSVLQEFLNDRNFREKIYSRPFNRRSSRDYVTINGSVIPL